MSFAQVRSRIVVLEAIASTGEYVASITFNPRKNILHNIDIGSQLNPKINNLVRDAFLSRICVPKRCPGRCRRGKGKGSVDRERSEGCVVGVAAEEMHLSQEKSA